MLIACSGSVEKTGKFPVQEISNLTYSFPSFFCYNFSFIYSFIKYFIHISCWLFLMERNITNLGMQSFLVEFSLPCSVLILDQVLFRAIFSIEIPKSFISTKSDSLELILIPQIIENGFDIAFIHTILTNVHKRATLTYECAISNVSMSALFQIAVHTEFIICIFL